MGHGGSAHSRHTPGRSRTPGPADPGNFPLKLAIVGAPGAFGTGTTHPKPRRPSFSVVDRGVCSHFFLLKCDPPPRGGWVLWAGRTGGARPRGGGAAPCSRVGETRGEAKIVEGINQKSVYIRTILIWKKLYILALPMHLLCI